MHVLWRKRGPARRNLGASFRYLLRGREVSNFTYDLANQDELTEFVAHALSVPSQLVSRFVEELEQDDELREALASRLKTHPNRFDTPRYTKRTGYYALVRVVKPQTVVETGTHDGLGATVIARPLQRNADEGHARGHVRTFDVDPEAGWLVPDFLEDFVQQVTGPTSETLAPALEGAAVDFFVHDSLRTPENERFEFETVIRRAAGPRLYLATDNAPDTDVLRDLCEERGAWYGAFQEKPKDHFFEGVTLSLGGVGGRRRGRARAARRPGVTP